jgi:multidrug efflux system membrane fusion protein
MPETRSGGFQPEHKRASRKTSPVKLIASVAVVALVAVSAGWALTHLGKSGQGGPGAAGRPGGGRGGFGRGGFAITVGTAPAAIGDVPITLDALGTVTPPVTAIITTRISGNLMAVYFQEGQMVKKGQKLALIDPRPYQVALEQAQGALAHDQAVLANAQLDLQRYKTLLAQNSVASQQVDTQAALVQQDLGLVKSDKAGVDNAKLNLDYTTITAPVAGRVGLRQVDIGNYVPAGSATGLVVLTQVDPIDVVFTIPEDYVPQITQRQRAGASLPVTVFDRGGGTTLGQGLLSTLDNQIDTATGTVKAKARFNNGAGLLFPNQFVNARLIIDNLCNAVVVPTTAVRHGSQGDFVYTLQPGNTAKMVIVKTGPGSGETVSIASGLNGGETVITEGGDRLRDGAPVNLPGQRPPGSGFSGGRRGRGGPGGGAQFQGGQFQGAPGAGGQSGGGGRGGQGRPGGVRVAQGSDVATQIRNSDAQGLRSPGSPAAQTPPDACRGPGKGKNGGRFGPGGHGPGGGQGPQAFAPGQGFPSRRFQGGQGFPGAAQGGPASAGQGQGDGRRPFQHRPGRPAPGAANADQAG